MSNFLKKAMGAARGGQTKLGGEQAANEQSQSDFQGQQGGALMGKQGDDQARQQGGLTSGFLQKAKSFNPFKK